MKKTTEFSIIMCKKDKELVKVIINKIDYVINGCKLFKNEDIFNFGESFIFELKDSPEFKYLSKKYSDYFDQMLIEKLIILFDEDSFQKLSNGKYGILEEIKDRLSDTNPKKDKMAKRFVYNYLESMNNDRKWCDLTAIETALSLTTKNKRLLNEYLSDENSGYDVSSLETFLEDV